MQNLLENILILNRLESIHYPVGAERINIHNLLDQIKQEAHAFDRAVLFCRQELLLEAQGTGLGLAIVKHVLLRHEAVLAIESQPEARVRLLCDLLPLGLPLQVEFDSLTDRRLRK